jgi:hypothetical protein
VKLRDGWLLGLKLSKQPYQAVTSLPSSLFPISVLYLDLYLAIFYQGWCGALDYVLLWLLMDKNVSNTFYFF